MNLLFLTPQLPHPPRQGTAIRNWGLLKSLSARHTIDLIAFAGAAEPTTPELRAACRRVETVPMPRRRLAERLHDLFLSPLPDLANRMVSPDFEARLRSLVQDRRYDALFVEGLELAPYLMRAQASSTITVFDAHNCETVLQRRAFETDLRSPRRWPAALYSFVQSGRLARFEADTCRRADRVTCVSTTDAAALRALVPGLNPVLIPNGIFLSDYPANPQPPSPASRLVFTGKMDYRPNVDAAAWFAGEILPSIRRRIPEIEFVIVGQKPVEAVQRLARQTGVRVTGAVDDARPYIAGAAVYVAPLRMGGGTRFKLLEAMALRRPIVSTTMGAEGFAVRSGRELMLADSASDFAAAVIALVQDEATRSALGAAGYAFVQAYDWDRIGPRLEQVLFATGPDTGLNEQTPPPRG